MVIAHPCTVQFESSADENQENNQSSADEHLTAVGFHSTPNCTESESEAGLSSKDSSHFSQDSVREINEITGMKNAKSKVLRKVSWASRITLLVGFINLLVILIAISLMLNSYQKNVERIHLAGDIRIRSQEILGLVRELYMAVEDIRAEGKAINSTHVKGEITQEAEQMHAILFNLVSGSTIGTDYEHWHDIKYRSEDVGEDAVSDKWMSLYQMMLTFLQYSFQIVYDTPSVGMWSRSHEFDFIMINGPNIILEGLSEAVDLYSRESETLSQQMTIVLIVILFASPMVIVFVGLFVFRPVLKTLKEDRDRTISLFISIPKESIQDTLKAITQQIKQHFSTGPSQRGTENLKQGVTGKMVTNFLLRFVSVTIAIFLISAPACASFGFYFLWSSSDVPHEVDSAAARLYLLRDVEIFSTEMLINETIFWENDMNVIRTSLQNSMDMITRISFALQYGDEELYLPTGNDDDPKQLEILYQTECQPYNTSDTKLCKGLDSLLTRLTLLIDIFVLLPDNDLTIDNNEVMEIRHEIQFLTHGQTKELMEDSLFIYLETFGEIMGLMNAINVIGFILLFPVLLFSYLVLHPMETAVKLQNRRTAKMLYMVPQEVRASIPEFQELLEGTTRLKSKNQTSLALSIEKNKAVLDVVAQAVILTDEKGIIQNYNNSAQNIFGFTSSELIGETITKIIPSNITNLEWNHSLHSGIRDAHEEVLRVNTKEGKQMDRKFLVHRVELSGKRHFVLQDFTPQHCTELVEDVFPSCVAEEMMLVDLKNTKNNEPLLADFFKDVTVGFVDIVGFTAMASKSSGVEVLRTLTAIFDSWDKVCQSHNVEKIKTIGDCMMICAGCPERRVDHAKDALEWAIDILETVKEFNKKNNSKIAVRIGLSSGSLMAGVLGTNRPTFDLWGDTVNTASRMESNGEPGRIQVSDTTYKFLSRDYLFEEKSINAKGKGTMLSFLYISRRETTSDKFTELNILEDSDREADEFSDQDELPPTLPGILEDEEGKEDSV